MLLLLFATPASGSGRAENAISIDEPSSAGVDAAVAQRIEQALTRRGDDAVQISNLDLYMRLVDGELLDALVLMDPSVGESLSQYDGRAFAMEKARANLLKTRPEIAFLRALRARLSRADQVLEVEPRGLEYDTKRGFRLHFSTDDSRGSADKLALGIVADGGDRADERDPPGLTIGTMRSFGCWLEPQGPDEYFRECGVRLAGIPAPVAERLEREMNERGPNDARPPTWIRIQIRWHGLPRTAQAKTLLIRGVGYDRRRVYVPEAPRLELVDADGKVLWSSR